LLALLLFEPRLYDARSFPEARCSRFAGTAEFELSSGKSRGPVRRGIKRPGPVAAIVRLAVITPCVVAPFHRVS
jgi:hypothetical protein